MIINITFAILFLVSVTTSTHVSSVLASPYALGVCQTATQSTGAEIMPTYAADDYLSHYHGNELRYKKFSFDHEVTKVTLIKEPAHGKVAYADNPKAIKWKWLNYTPGNNFVGRDNFVMQVEKDGVKVRIEYLIESLSDDEPTTYIGDGGERQGIYCNPAEWKISSNRVPHQNIKSIT